MKVSEVTELKNPITEVVWFIPLVVAGARVALPWAAKAGARVLIGSVKAVPMVGRGVATGATAAGRLGTGVGIGATGLAINDVVNMTEDNLIPLIKNVLGSSAAQKIAMFAGKYSLPLIVVVAILYGGTQVAKALMSKSPKEMQDESYKQKDGDYARGNEPTPAKKRRGPHPLGGKLVG